MQRLNGNDLFDYFIFSDNCKEFFTLFYEFIKKKTHYFYDYQNTSKSESSIETRILNMNQYMENAKKLQSHLEESNNLYKFIRNGTDNI